MNSQTNDQNFINFWPIKYFNFMVKDFHSWRHKVKQCDRNHPFKFHFNSIRHSIGFKLEWFFILLIFMNYY